MEPIEKGGKDLDQSIDITVIKRKSVPEEAVGPANENPRGWWKKKEKGDNEERYRNGERKRTISAISWPVEKSPYATLDSYFLIRILKF